MDIILEIKNLIQESKIENPGRYRKFIKPGLLVYIVLKKDQKTGTLTKGIVKNILTSKKFHSRGIKVRLEDGQVGRVQCIPDLEECI